MEEWLHVATKHAVVLIDWMALALIAIGTLEAFVNGFRAISRSPAQVTKAGQSGCAMRAGSSPA